MPGNTYTTIWFATYLDGYDPARTQLELDFVARQLPLPGYRSVLDLCCGSGRHAVPLAARGYAVTGIDRDTAALARARSAATGRGEAVFVESDMRDLAALPGTFDAVLSLWHSFGYFDAETNAEVLQQVQRKLRQGGRFILDVFHRDYWAAHLGTDVAERSGRTITSTRALRGDRMTVHIDYGSDVAPDDFDWQIYNPGALRALASTRGFRTLLTCSWCDETRTVTPEDARMQLVFERA